jgi:zeaxanthin glucosyltransferase
MDCRGTTQPLAEGVVRRQTFLFMVGPHISMLNAVLGVARRLRRRGHIIHFVTGNYSEAVTDAGFCSHQAPWLLGIDTDELTRLPRSLRSKVFKDWARVAQQGATDLISSLQPSIILFQPFLLTSYPFFWKAGARSAASFSTKPLLTADPWVPPYTSRRIPERSIKGSAAVAWDWLGTSLRYASYRTRWLAQDLTQGFSYRTLLVSAAKATGFPLRLENESRPLWIDLKFRSVPELVLHAHEFEFVRKRGLPPGVRYLGPCIDADRADRHFDIPAGNGPLIVCNLGTVGVQSTSKQILYTRIIEAVEREHSWRLVMATGQEESARSLQAACRTPERIYVQGWIPMVAALREADLLINHGGANSTKEALHFGIPILAFPEHADQPGIAARIVHHGVGSSGAENAATEWIHDQIATLVSDPRYRRESLRFRDIFMQYDVDKVAERTLEDLASTSSLSKVS